jgi:hypothetical protein
MSAADADAFGAQLLRRREAVFRFAVLRALVFRRDVVFRAAVLRDVVLRDRAVVRFAELRFVVPRFAVLRFVVLRLRLDELFFRRDWPDSDIAMAIACLRLFTFLPDPLRSEPRLCSPITFLTLRR